MLSLSIFFYLLTMKHQKNTHAHMQANINVYGPFLMPLISLSVQFSRSVVLDSL